MQKFLDFIYVLIFGRRTLDGFVNNKIDGEKCKYIFVSVFPNEEILNIALPPSKTMSISK